MESLSYILCQLLKQVDKDTHKVAFHNMTCTSVTSDRTTDYLPEKKFTMTCLLKTTGENAST